MKTSKLAKFFMMNADELTKAKEFEKQLSFTEFSQSTKQQRILQRLKTYRSIDYAISPEDILIEEEEQCRMAYAILQLRAIIGVRNFQLMVERYVYERKIKDIATKYGMEYIWCTRVIKNSARKAKEIILDMVNNHVLDGDLLASPKGTYYAKTPVVKTEYPFDAARKSFHRITKRKGNHCVQTHCLAVEYLDDSFKDKKTICNYCGNQCTRKETMEERI